MPLNWDQSDRTDPAYMPETAADREAEKAEFTKEHAHDRAVEFIASLMRDADKHDLDFDDLWERTYDALSGVPAHDEAEKLRKQQIDAERLPPPSAPSPAQAVFAQLNAMNAAYVAGLKAGRGE